MNSKKNSKTEIMHIVGISLKYESEIRYIVTHNLKFEGGLFWNPTSEFSVIRWRVPGGVKYCQAEVELWSNN